MTTTRRLHVVDMAAAPEPPYPADTKANGYKPELDWQRVKSSKTWRLCPPDMHNNLLRLWLESWNEVPCGSWENDDELIAAAIELPARIFMAHRDQLMRGWRLHADGRYYHPVIADQVAGMIASRYEANRANRERQARWRNKKREEREKQLQDGVTLCPVTVTLRNAKEQEQEQDIKENPPSEDKRKSAASAKPHASPNGSRLPLTELPDDWRTFCQTERPDLDPRKTWETFHDYWIAQPGAKGRKIDWLATWRNWVRKQDTARNGGIGNGRTSTRPTNSADRADAAWEKISGRLLGGGVSQPVEDQTQRGVRGDFHEPD